jgi:hypothetical protein
VTTQRKQPQSIFPDYPHEQIVTQKDGSLTSAWFLSFSSLYQALQVNFKNEGIVLPPLTADNIATIQAIYTPLIGAPLPQNIPDISGQTIFDSTNRVPKVFIITYDGATPPNIVTASWKTYVLM